MAKIDVSKPALVCPGKDWKKGTYLFSAGVCTPSFCIPVRGFRECAPIDNYLAASREALRGNSHAFHRGGFLGRLRGAWYKDARTAPKTVTSKT